MRMRWENTEDGDLESPVLRRALYEVRELARILAAPAITIGYLDTHTVPVGPSAYRVSTIHVAIDGRTQWCADLRARLGRWLTPRLDVVDGIDHVVIIAIEHEDQHPQRRKP